MIGIYKITSPKGKVYIAQTINWETRQKHYKNTSAKRQPKLYYSLKKYGWEFFQKEFIEECSIEHLDERETFHKQQFINECGWKMALFCELYDSGGGPKSESTKLKMSKSHLGKKSSKETCNKISQGKLGMKYIKSQITRKGNPIPVLQYTLDGIFIKEWKSFTQASKEMNICISSINKSASGKNKSSGGYIWKYKNQPIPLKYDKSRKGKDVLQYDLKGNFIKEWGSISKAAVGYGCNMNPISACLLGKHKTSGGYIWKFKNN